MMKKISGLLIIVLIAIFPSLSVAQKESAKIPEEKKFEIVKLTKEEFEKKIYDPVKDGDAAVYKGDIPCIIDFYADWCRPCKLLSPILEELYREYDGKIIVYKVNVDEQKALASIFGITSIPTLFLFPLKQKPFSVKGLLPKEEIKKYIDQYLKP